MRYGVVFFFKQKTAYEMRISDWSSDVCSSDLCVVVRIQPDVIARADLACARRILADGDDAVGFNHAAGVTRAACPFEPVTADRVRTDRSLPEIGRASCRARVC